MQTNDQYNAATPDVSLEGITLHVADVESSLAFYTKIPGVRIEMQTALSLTAHAINLMLVANRPKQSKG